MSEERKSLLQSLGLHFAIALVLMLSVVIGHQAIPQPMAPQAVIQATFIDAQAIYEKQQAALLKAAQKRAKEFDGFELEITQKSGIDGKLFGSVTNIDITESVTNAGHEIVKSEIRMPDGPIKLTGEHMITLVLHQEVTIQFKLTVIGEE